MTYRWEKYFKPHILSRGQEYYFTGSVLNVERCGLDDLFYDAIVEGSTEYHVEIQLSGDEVVEMDCDCPYAMDGNNCKHMAAVLYEIFEGVESEEEQEDAEDGNEGGVPSTSLMDAIERIPDEDLRPLLAEICAEDERVKNRILVRYASSAWRTQMGRLLRELENMTDSHLDRHGYINWEHASDYGMEVERFLEDHVRSLIGRGCAGEAFDLTNQTLAHVWRQELDDSDGILSGIASVGYDCWSKILAAANPAQKQIMFEWFEANMERDDVPDYLEDVICDFFVNEFHDEEFLRRKLQIFDVGETIPEKDDWHACYQYENNVLRCLDLMEELGDSDVLIREYMEKHKALPDVRKFAANRAIRTNHVEEAIRILQESKQLDSGREGLVAESSKELIRLYGKLGRTEAYREELLFQIFHCRQNDLSQILMLKAACAAGDWEGYRERILNANSCYGVRYALMESEGLMDRLLQEVIRSGSVHLLERYEKTLKELYPEQVRDAFAAYVRRGAADASKRADYYHLMQYLRKLRSYPGGSEMAAEIAGNWRVFYSRRSAMMDELRKAGF